MHILCYLIACHREREVDAQLRALKTSEIPTRLTREQLETLLAECAGCQAIPPVLGSELHAEP